MRVMSLYDFLVGQDTNSKERNKWIEKNLSELAPGMKILDAGAGELKWKKCCNHLEYISQDFCEYKGDENGKGLQHEEWDINEIDIVSDIIDIPVQDSEFDAILCSEVLEHLPYPELAIKEFSRILKEDGILLITAPFCSLTHFAPYHYSTGFSEYWYKKVLLDSGFEILEIVPNGNFFAYMRQEILRIHDVLVRYTGKKCLIMRLLAYALIFTFKKHIISDNNSNELLCFGYMVRARKL